MKITKKEEQAIGRIQKAFKNFPPTLGMVLTSDCNEIIILRCQKDGNLYRAMKKYETRLVSLDLDYEVARINNVEMEYVADE